MVIGETELLESLLDAFADLGFEGTSVRGICRHLGISHNLIHSRYQSKEAAWYAAVDHGFAQLFSLMTMEPDEVPDDTMELLRHAMHKYVAATLAHPGLARVIQEESSRPGPRFDYMLERYITPTRELTAALLLELQEAGVVREGAVEAVYFFLTTWGIGGLASAAPEIRGSAALSSEDVARLAVDVVLDGLRVPGSREIDVDRTE